MKLWNMLTFTQPLGFHSKSPSDARVKRLCATTNWRPRRHSSLTSKPYDYGGLSLNEIVDNHSKSSRGSFDKPLSQRITSLPPLRSHWLSSYSVSALVTEPNRLIDTPPNNAPCVSNWARCARDIFCIHGFHVRQRDVTGFLSFMPCRHVCRDAVAAQCSVERFAMLARVFFHVWDEHVRRALN